MKKILFIIGLLLSITTIAEAQLGDRLLDRVKRRAEEKANEKADKAVDKAADKAEEKVTKKKKKKGESAVQDENSSSSSSSSDDTNSAPSEPASETLVTKEGTAFTNKISVNTIVFSEKTYDFEPNPNPVLNGIGTTLQQKLKKEKLLIKIYQRTTGDNASKAEEEFMAIKMYLVNRYDLNEDRIFFHSPAAKKAGANRTVEFVMVPDAFMDTDAAKY